MSVLISGVLIDPAGMVIPGAEITFTAITNGHSVLNGFSASATTNGRGEYAISLELCDYSISVQYAGNNAVYGSVSINKDTTPTTINDLLEKTRLEQAVTPQIIVYFREIQADVNQKLSVAGNAASSAANSANASAASAASALQAANNASNAAGIASNAASSAAGSAATAQKSATQAEVWAKTIDVSNFAQKDGTGINAASFRNNLGLGNSSTRNVGTSSGTVAAGDDARLGTIGGRSGGAVIGEVIAGGASPASTPVAGTYSNGVAVGSRFLSGVYSDVSFFIYPQVVQQAAAAAKTGILQLSHDNTYVAWMFNSSGVATGASWSPTSDERLKNLDGPITEPLQKMRRMRGQTWTWKTNGAFGIGITAQDIQRVFPEAVIETNDVKLPNGDVVERALSPDTYGVAAALHHEAILALADKINEQESLIEALSVRLSELDAR
ncbi:MULTISPECIES: prophage tail fiber N-terminal domain-containing protein [Dickeya]|uniref:Phage tail fiber protein n=1 Tax=Dickeya aquatica TaxID=1401087 RepID=A0A375ABK5_9GAMM|nr:MULTISPECIES: prophage tail fiber N-terminal domain-containing protein [Dickeya]SLM63494.1 Phage tail fiber protein [Dickeya aquatica]